MRSEEFLDKYKKLEEALNLKYGFDEKTFGSPVVKFINDREGKDYREYITGTILMNEDSYYGTGIFRTSSLEVLNKGDDRKIGYVLTDDIEAFGGKCILL